MKSNGTRILLTRHGETANSDQKCYNGHFDVDMSDNGKRQIEALAEKLSKESVTAVYCSDLKRSAESAAIIAEKHSVNVSKNKNLREFNYGRWEGLPFEEVKKRFPEEMNARVSDYINYRIKGGGENLKDFHNRIIKAIKKIIPMHKNETIVIAVHGGVNKVVLSWALCMGLKSFYKIKQDFAALNILTFYEKDEVIVELVNETCK